MSSYIELLGCRVRVDMKSGAIYAGVLNGIREDKIHLTKLSSYPKEGIWRATPKSKTKRWLAKSKVQSVAVEDVL